jgi:hypothetical protein
MGLHGGPWEPEKMDTIWKADYGFRNKKRLRTVILFHLGGLDLNPSTH